MQTRDKMQGFIQNTLFKKTAIYKHPPLQKSNLFKFSYEQCSGEITSLKSGSIRIFTLFFFLLLPLTRYSNSNNINKWSLGWMENGRSMAVRWWWSGNESLGWCRWAVARWPETKIFDLDVFRRGAPRWVETQGSQKKKKRAQTAAQVVNSERLTTRKSLKSLPLAPPEKKKTKTSEIFKLAESEIHG